MTASYTRELARFVVESDPAEVPSEIRHQGVRSLVNWIGNPIGACHSDTVERVISALGGFSGTGNARLLGRGDRIDTVMAAFINCVSSSIYDFDDAHLATVIHPTGPVASALLALGESQVITGDQFVHALLLGIEVQCRLANALAIAPAEIDDGWFLTGLTGPVGAAVATGRILGLTEQQMVGAIGVAAARAAGTRETHGSMAKNFVPAWGADWGLQAALLARHDVSGSETPLEGARGIGAMFARQTNFPALVDGLGQRWDLTDNAFKPYPSGIVMHGAITAAEDLASDPEFDVDAVERVDVVVHPQCLKLTGLRTPRNAAEGTFSIYHWVALTLLNRRVHINQFSDDSVLNPVVIELRDRINATQDPSFAKDEVYLRVTLKSSRVLEQHVYHAVGSKERPLADEALTVKLHDLADDVIGVGAANELERRCWDVQNAPDIADIVSAACGVVDN